MLKNTMPKQLTEEDPDEGIKEIVEGMVKRMVRQRLTMSVLSPPHLSLQYPQIFLTLSQYPPLTEYRITRIFTCEKPLPMSQINRSSYCILARIVCIYQQVLRFYCCELINPCKVHIHVSSMLAKHSSNTIVALAVCCTCKHIYCVYSKYILFLCRIMTMTQKCHWRISRSLLRMSDC